MLLYTEKSYLHFLRTRFIGLVLAYRGVLSFELLADVLKGFETGYTLLIKCTLLRVLKQCKKHELIGNMQLYRHTVFDSIVHDLILQFSFQELDYLCTFYSTTE